jgi:hypothetical protein
MRRLAEFGPAFARSSMHPEMDGKHPEPDLDGF